jgi:hypothetical protein
MDVGPPRAEDFGVRAHVEVSAAPGGCGPRWGRPWVGLGAELARPHLAGPDYDRTQPAAQARIASHGHFLGSARPPMGPADAAGRRSRTRPDLALPRPAPAPSPSLRGSPYRVDDPLGGGDQGVGQRGSNLLAPLSLEVVAERPQLVGPALGLARAERGDGRPGAVGSVRGLLGGMPSPAVFHCDRPGRSVVRGAKPAVPGKKLASKKATVPGWFALPPPFEDPDKSGLSWTVGSARVEHDIELPSRRCGGPGAKRCSS